MVSGAYSLQKLDRNDNQRKCFQSPGFKKFPLKDLCALPCKGKARGLKRQTKQMGHCE